VLGAAGAGAARALKPLRVQGKLFGKQSLTKANAVDAVEPDTAVIVGVAESESPRVLWDATCSVAMCGAALTQIGAVAANRPARRRRRRRGRARRRRGRARRSARQTISASAPAVARVVLQVASALAPAEAPGFSFSEVTFFRLRIKGHVADAHTVVVVS
jgi:hypothetical protein